MKPEKATNFEVSSSQPTQAPPPQTAIVLAGGLGTRLRTAILDRPKVLAPAAGRPFLDYVLTYLARQGIKHVILSIGYQAEQIRAFVMNGNAWNINVIYSLESQPLGTGGALRLAFDKLSASSTFALNGDSLFKVNLSTLWEAHIMYQAEATLALRGVRSEEWLQRGCVTLRNDGRILSFDEKPDASHVLSSRENFPQGISSAVDSSKDATLVNGGIYVLQKTALESIAVGANASLEREVFPHLAQLGTIAGIVLPGYFADIGTPQSLETFEKDVIQGTVDYENRQE